MLVKFTSNHEEGKFSRKSCCFKINGTYPETRNQQMDAVAWQLALGGDGKTREVGSGDQHSAKGWIAARQFRQNVYLSITAYQAEKIGNLQCTSTICSSVFDDFSCLMSMKLHRVES